MEQQIITCPKCSKEIGEVEFYKYHRRCKDCWNAYCKSHRYPNKEVNKRAMEKYKAAHPVTERFCKCCKQDRPVEMFDPRKHFCKDCYRSPEEIKKAYQERRKEQLKEAKAKWYENNKEREREKHKKAYREKVGEKTIKVKPIKATKVKVEKPKRRKGVDIENRRLKQREWYKKQKALKPKQIKEKPVRIPKAKVIREQQICQIKMTETRVYPKVSDVRKGWAETMAKLKAKFETA